MRLFVLLAISSVISLSALEARQAAPRFQVDPSWPQELPNNWIFGSITGVYVDSRQHVWVTHLPETLTEEELGLVQKPPLGECCQAAPSVVEFDPQGKVVELVRRRLAGRIAVAAQPAWHLRRSQQLRLGRHAYASPRDEVHARGQAVLTIGEMDKNAGSNDTTLLGGPAGIWVDPKTNEAFIADGYRNRRVIVFDAATGKYLRHWGAYGKPPDDTQKPANDPNAAEHSSSPPCTASPARATAGSTSPIGAATASRSSIRSGNFITRKDHRAEHARVGIGVVLFVLAGRESD